MTREDAITAIVGRVLKREDGVVTLPGEAFETRWGQTPAWLATYDLPVPQTVSEAATNYRRWLHVTRLDDLCDVDDALPDIVIDWSVHAGVGVAVRALQTALHVRPDGVIGPITLAALVGVDRHRLAGQVLADNARQYGRLITSNPGQFAQYAKGWLNRLAGKIETLTA